MIIATPKLLKSSLVVVFTTLVALLFLARAGVWLLVSDQVPARLDTVFTFAGEAARVRYSRELVEKNVRAHWLLSDYEDGYARLLKLDGFTMDRVTAVDTCTNTYSEVRALQSFLNTSTWLGIRQPPNPLKVGLVSSPYHMRRIKIMIERTINDDSIEFYYLPVPLERYSLDAEMYREWWRYENVGSTVILELMKIFYFWLIS
ncbi:ElyC/SanA/YdcF family protein [Chitinispirillales bacterium ANBcel5]|uniref:ElyC/SanA/YdcF family protein n=1 Tax=Cellulosispirillum alkaliphilum TaxID=3039283 RepID=UPI002A50E069|nr:ElyC/SanA/YdcF family protein [Chitinispirillales bacterium ANBcel5]